MPWEKVSGPLYLLDIIQSTVVCLDIQMVFIVSEAILF
jgi:hypothetical protein